MHQTRLLFLSLTLAATIGGCGWMAPVNSGRADHRTRPATAPIQTAKRNSPPAHAPAWGFRTTHHYRYYPEAGVYYAPDRDTYFWNEDGIWYLAVKLPDRLLVKLHDPIGVALETPEPWTRHDEVLAKVEARAADRQANGVETPAAEPDKLDFQSAYVSD